MNIYLQMAIVAAITIYIVDCSGFTQSWRGLIARLVGTTEPRLRSIKPFDCSLCMTFWVTTAYTLVLGQFSLVTLAVSAGLSLLSFPFSQLLIFIREGLNALIGKSFKLLK